MNKQKIIVSWVLVMESVKVLDAQSCLTVCDPNEL